jgi:phosphoribosylaminoimidazole-succinocarboxamide synthase
MEPSKHVEIDGIDCTGKTTLVTILTPLYPHLKFHDRGLLTKLTDVFEDDLPQKLSENTIYIILDAEVDICVRRSLTRNKPRDEYDSFEGLYKYRNRYRRLAVRYDTWIIDTTKLKHEEVVEIVKEIIKNEFEKNNCFHKIGNFFLRDHKYPNPDEFDENKFNQLPLIAEGESKIIRGYDDRFSLIKYKPTVYSHKQQRAGTIPYTDQERMQMTKYMLEILDLECIPHCYIYIGKQYVLCERLDPLRDIPPIEVIVKKCFVGSDKYRYFNMEQKVGRDGRLVVNEKGEYSDLVVRFDYRNPNHHPETKKPMGDETLCDDLANKFIIVKESKKLARQTFKALDKHFKNMGIYFVDVCFMITTNGKKHYSEISQDCGRYKKINEKELESLDKDVWRAGGSSDLVHEKWRQITLITKEYVKNTLFKKVNPSPL